MPVTKESVGRRIRECAEAANPPLSPTDVLKRLLPILQERDKKANLTRQTVSYWFHGKHFPPNEVVLELADILGTTPEYLMFGKRRGEQLKHERLYLSRITEDEGDLLTLYREASATGKRAILGTVRAIAKENPAPQADVHPLRRKNDTK